MNPPYSTTKTQTNEYIKPGVIEEISIAITIDKNNLPTDTTIEDLKELKHKVENDEFSEEFEKVRLYSRVVNWNNEHRLNLFNAQDSLISFMKEYNDFEDIDFNYYRELIEAISNVYPSYSNDERESISKQDMSYLEQFLNDETTVDGDINGNDN